jgi:hypothetical protein
MAGIKITDLSALSVAESGDYLCIVDVSDTSQSPAGTTKKIELGNVANSGIFYPITNAVLSANVVSPGGSYAQYFVSGKSMILGVYFQELDIDFDASTDASIIIDLPTDTGYSAATASGSASIIFHTAPTAAATPVFSLCQYASTGKVEIKLQNYGGEVSDIYDITATFVIELV